MRAVTTATVFKLTVCAALAMMLHACSSTPATQDRFVQASATTWRVASDAIVFERTEARFSRSARDYIYLGPVAINNRGAWEYLLWVGIASTLDRGFLAPEADLPASLTLFIDDEPLELVVTDWSQRAPAISGEVPYLTPVQVQQHFAARVTLDQIALLDSQGSDRLIVRSTDGNNREFLLWNDSASWQSFVSQGAR